jgi:hypothetical protein
MKESQKIFKIAVDSMLEGLKKTLPDLSEYERMVILSLIYKEQYREYPGSHSIPELMNSASKLD